MAPEIENVSTTSFSFFSEGGESFKLELQTLTVEYNVVQINVQCAGGLSD